MPDRKSKLEILCAERGLKMTDQRRMIAAVGGPEDARIDAVDDTAKTSDAGKTDAKQPEAIEPAAPPADENVTKTRIAAMGKVADAQFGVDKAKAEPTYGVTLARCKGQSSESMQAACRDGAQKTLSSAVASAKARNDAARRRAAMAQSSGQNG